MALIKCPECGREISDRAGSCPGCGCPVKVQSINNNEVLCSIDGVNGQLYLYANRVVIKRKGVLAKMTQGFFKGEKEIFLDQISGVQIKRGNLITNGYMQFTLAGGNENTKGILDATQDENTVMFSKGQNDRAESFKRKMYELKG